MENYCVNIRVRGAENNVADNEPRQFAITDINVEIQRLSNCVMSFTRRLPGADYSRRIFNLVIVIPGNSKISLFLRDNKMTMQN